MKDLSNRIWKEKGDEMEEELIKSERCVIAAADVPDLGKLEELVKATHDIEGIGGYKVGFVLAIKHGLPAVVETIRKYTKKPIIYDHQKAGTDIPKLGKAFAEAVVSSGVDAVIIFPFGGAATERDWIDALKEAGVTILAGGHMTQSEFLASEGGFIHDEAPEKMYTIAAERGVTNFVVPGNKLEFVKKYKELLEKLLGKGNFRLWAPGFIDQGGNITEFGEEAEFFCAIVGSAIYRIKAIRKLEEGEKPTVEEMRKAAKIVTSQL